MNDEPLPKDHEAGSAVRSAPSERNAARRWALPIALLGLVAFLAGILVAYLAMRPTDPAAGALRSAQDGAAATVASSNRSGATISRPVPVPVDSSGVDDAARGADAEICGMPGLALDPALSLDNDPRFAARVDAANRSLIETLSANPDERLRAAGLLLQRSEDLRAAKKSEAASIDALCGADEACVDVARKQLPRTAVIQSATPATDALARAAATTRDPLVYAAAMDVCTGYARVGPPGVPACQLVTAEQWARIDPDNVDAWLHVAGAAADRNDTAALDDAMNHVAHAKTSRIYGDAVAALVDAAIPSGTDEFGATQMHVAAWTLYAGWSLPPLQAAMRYCAEPLLMDSNRWQICDAMAHQFVDNGSSMIERAIGIRLGARLGWPPDTVVALRQEQDALQRAQHLGVDPFKDSSSCRAVAKMRAQVQLAARIGEVGAARVALVSSGKSIAALAAEVEIERESTRKASPPDKPASAASGP